MNVKFGMLNVELRSNYQLSTCSRLAGAYEQTSEVMNNE